MKLFERKWFILAIVLLNLSCKSEVRNTLKNQQIPVHSLDGDELDSAFLTFHDEFLQNEGLNFQLFSLNYESSNVHEWLNLKGKYWYQSPDLILIASKVENRKNKKVEIVIDTLINTKSADYKTIYKFKAAYYGFNWQSRRFPDKIAPHSNIPTHYLEIEDVGYKPGPKCIFVFDNNLKILGFKVRKLELIKDYR